jgi:7-cyano-7-deazaguanine synthase
MNKEKPSALVLLSGGMDSATLLYYVVKKLNYTKVEALGFDYGQKHKKELSYAKKLAKKLNISFKIIRIDLRQIGGSPLVSNSKVPNQSEDKQYTTVVPGRNSIFLSIASAYAETKGLQDVFFAPNLEDFKSYPDCRDEFVLLISQALAKGSNIRGIYAPFVNMSKIEIVKLGKELGVPYELTWSCYKGGKTHCGKCDACVERFNALKYVGVKTWK